MPEPYKNLAPGGGGEGGVNAWGRPEQAVAQSQSRAAQAVRVGLCQLPAGLTGGPAVRPAHLSFCRGPDILKRREP